MATLYKDAPRWALSRRPSGATGVPTTSFFKDKRSGKIVRKPKRGSGTTDPDIGQPTNPSQPYKRWKGLPSGGTGKGGLPKWRGLGGGALGYLIDNADEFEKWDYDTWRDFIDNGNLPAPFDFLNRRVLPPGVVAPDDWPVPVDPGEEHIPNTVRPGPTDGLDYWFDIPDGMGDCGGRWPLFGNPGDMSGDRDVFMFRKTGHSRNEAGPTACGTWGGGLTHPDGVGMPPDTLYPYWGAYTQRWRIAGGFFRGDIIPWIMFRYPDGTPLRDIKTPHMFPPVPTGSPAPAPVREKPKYGYMPGQPWTGYPEPDPNVKVPMRYAPFVKTAQILGNIRFDSGYDPEKMPWQDRPTTSVSWPIPTPGASPPRQPPVVTRPVEPYNPPGGKRDKKTKVVGRGLFQAVQRGFHALTEYNDFIESFYDALPKKYQTCKVGGPACKTAKVMAHFDEVDIPTAVVNWMWNDFEDRMLGKFHGGLDKAAKKLGTRDWKLLNGYNESPLDEGLGELYGEFVKDHVNPTKKEFVKWIKKELL